MNVGAHLEDLVVEVLHHGRNGWWTSSGLLVGSGLVLTSSHGVDGADEVFVIRRS